jgi:hypothetical protein
VAPADAVRGRPLWQPLSGCQVRLQRSGSLMMFGDFWKSAEISWNCLARLDSPTDPWPNNFGIFKAFNHTWSWFVLAMRSCVKFVAPGT